MRNLRKLTAVVIAIALVLTSMATVFAAATPANADKAATLKDLGLYAGKDATNPAVGLEDALEVQQSLVYLANMFGYKADADKMTDDEATKALAKFADADKIAGYAKNVVAYSAANGIIAGTKTNDGKLYVKPTATVTAARFATFIINGLGYELEGSYTEAVAQLAEINGNKIDAAAAGDLTRDAAIGMMYGALTAKTAAGKTVVENLVAATPALEAVAVKAGLIVPATLSATNVTVLNLKQVKIDFSGALVKDVAEKIDNYAVTEGSTNKASGGSVALQADGKSVIVTLGQAVGNGATAKVEVKNFVTYKNDSVKFEDSTIPSIVGVTVAGPNTLTVEFSEPVQFTSTSAAITAGEFKLDGGNYIVSSLALDVNKVTVTAGVNFTEGTHKISFEAKDTLKDYAGYKYLPKTVEFTVANDKAAPVLTVKSQDPKKVVLASNKTLNKSKVKDGNVRYRHTYNSNTYELLGSDAAVTVNDAGTEITLDFTGKVIPLGSNKLYISYDNGSGTKIEDLWGNKLEATSLDLSITLDTVKPTVTEVKFDSPTTLKVIFSENVEKASAETAGNYSVKDSAGKAVSISSAVKGSGDDQNKVTLNTAEMGGGSYSIEIKGVKDEAFVNNVMDAYTTTLTFADKIAPKVTTSAAVVAFSDSNKKASIYIPFSEVMDASTLVKGNFMKNVNGAGYVSLGDDDSVTAAGDGKSVTIVLDKSAVAFSTVAIKVGIVKDVAGNGLQNYVQDVTLGTDSIALKSVEATSTKQLKVTFTGRLSTVAAPGFILATTTNAAVGAINLSVATHTINNDGLSEVVFNLGSDLKEDATINGATAYLIVSGAADTKSYLGAVIDNGNKALTDKIAPTVKDVKVINATTIEVTLNENAKADTFAKTLNGFSVSGGDAELSSVAVKVANTDGAVIVLTGKNFVGDSTVVKYTSAAGLTDVSGNKIADFEKTAAK